jgi:hypothetical protein
MKRFSLLLIVVVLLALPSSADTLIASTWGSADPGSSGQIWLMVYDTAQAIAFQSTSVQFFEPQWIDDLHGPTVGSSDYQTWATWYFKVSAPPGSYIHGISSTDVFDLAGQYLGHIDAPFSIGTPEPSSLAMLGLGIIAWAAARARSRSR